MTTHHVAFYQGEYWSDAEATDRELLRQKEKRPDFNWALYQIKRTKDYLVVTLRGSRD